MTTSPVQHYEREPSTFAKRFFWLSIAIFAVGYGIARSLVSLSSAHAALRSGHFPPAFWFSSILLFIGSFSLHVALHAVRLEKRLQFRRALIVALIAGTLFVGIQGFGLWCLIRQQNAEDVSTGSGAFVIMLAALHGIHFIVALMFLAYVVIKGFAARYDHEYFWGVQVCTWFWHALGVIWVAILGVFLITAWRT